MDGVLHSGEPGLHPAAARAEGGIPEPPTGDEVSALRAIVEGTARGTGEEFFRTLVRHLAQAIDVGYAFVAEFAEVNTRARTLAYWARDHIRDNVEWDLAGTPCEDVVRGSLCHHPSGVKDKFPHDEPMVAVSASPDVG